MNDARTLTLDLGGKWFRSYGVAPCPVCQSERRKDQDALTLADSDGKLLLHCKKSGCAFGDVTRAAGLVPGDFAQPDPAASAQRKAEQKAHDRKRALQAQRLWNTAQPIDGTWAESYLRGRGISCPLPDTLRFIPDCWHVTAKRFPALVALIEGSDGFSVHRTYLDPNVSVKAEIKPAKMMLGTAHGGAVRLSEAQGGLAVAEGIETALSLCSGLLRRPATVWATLSASGMKSLRLPPIPSRLTIATDGDKAGREAGQTLAERATALGWKVSLLPAPDGRDWNDVLNLKGAPNERA